MVITRPFAQCSLLAPVFASVPLGEAGNPIRLADIYNVGLFVCRMVGQAVGRERAEVFKGSTDLKLVRDKTRR